MIPFGNQTVTLLARNRVVGEDGRTHENWTRHTLTGCSWRSSAVQTADSNAVRNDWDYTCRIPGDQRKPQVGDVLILGTVAHLRVAASITAQEAAELLNSLRTTGAFRVESVRDNAMAGFPAPHYVARG